MARITLRDIPYSLKYDQSLVQYGKVTAAPAANATKITILLWVKFSSLTTLKTLFQWNVGATDRCACSQNAGSDTMTFNSVDHTHGDLQCIPLTSKLPRNVWIRLCLTLDQTISSNQNVIYANGVSIVTAYSVNQNCTVGIPTSDLWIAANSGVQTFDGNLIFERVIIGKAFTAAEALSEYQTGIIPSGGTPLLTYLNNEGQGTSVVDSSGNAKNIVLTSAPAWTNDTPMMLRPAIRDIPYSLQYNGSNQFGTVTAVPFANATQATILCWVKLAALTPSGGCLLETSVNGNSVNGLSLFVVGDQIQAVTHDQTNGSLFSIVLSTTHLQLGIWYRVCAVFNEAIATNQVNVYINGLLSSGTRSLNQNCTSGFATNDCYTGMRGGATLALNGNEIIDHIITGKAFTAAEVRSEYLTGIIPSGGAPLLTYTTNEGSGTSIIDSSGNAKNIVLSNAPVWTNDSPSHSRLSQNDAPSIISGGQLWLRADQGIAMINGAVSSWAGIGRSDGRALAQSTASKRPLMVVGQNGRPAIRFDGVDDFLQAVFTLPQPATVFIVYKNITPGALNTNDCVFNDGNLTNAMFYGNTTTDSRLYAGTQYSPITSTVASGSYAYAQIVFNGASSKIRANGIDLATGNPGTGTGGGGIQIGASSANSRATNIEVCEVIITSTVPTAAEVVAVENYFKIRYAL